MGLFWGFTFLKSKQPYLEKKNYEQTDKSIVIMRTSNNL